MPSQALKKEKPLARLKVSRFIPPPRKLPKPSTLSSPNKGHPILEYIGRIILERI